MCDIDSREFTLKAALDFLDKRREEYFVPLTEWEFVPLTECEKQVLSWENPLIARNERPHWTFWISGDGDDNRIADRDMTPLGEREMDVMIP